MKLKKILEYVFILISVIGFFLWMLSLMVNGYESRQISLFFNEMSDFFADFLNTVGYCGQRDPYNNLSYVGWEHKQYPPLAYVFFWGFSQFVADMDPYYERGFFLNMYQEHLFLYMLIVFWVSVLIFVFELVLHNKNDNAFIKYGTAIAILLSFPILFSLERGNSYLFVIVFVMIFIFNYNSNSKILREFALLSLAVAFGLKMTPAILGILLIYEKRWADAIRAALYGMIAFFAPFLLFKDGFMNLFYFLRNMRISAKAHSPFDGVSVLGSVSYCIERIFPGGVDYNIQTILIIVNYVICLLLLVFGFFYKHKWQTILAITLASISISGQANEYCLLMLVPFVIEFLNDAEHDAIMSIIILTAIFMIFLTYRISFILWDVHIGVMLLLLVELFEGVKDFLNYGKNKYHDSLL
ncbi:glycosyltransferase 87 family protein [Butyrivibrio sp. FCS006]|uniref:glycosyltransferase 87 family protein n=1 Tax=Butyrivibrio sp. FCS006 TaxID=1280684 RepID=UPI000428EAFC|nr:glycosyltransferase 87 family protein [Butyrivibrio sp. FCS006]